MESRTCVVTGASSGIGLATAYELARAGHQVVLVCRNPEKSRRVAAEIAAEVPGTDAPLIVGDLSTKAGVMRVADELVSHLEGIGVLINNAGVWMTRRTLNADGIETTFMVNHLAPFLLTNLLLERLKQSAPARVVNVNAGLYAMGEVDLERLPAGDNFHRMKTYAHTKLCNVMFTRELARRMEGTGVTVNALHPGVIRTNLGDSSGPLGMMLRLVKRFWATPEEGARHVVRLAIAPELEGVNGKYFDKDREIPYSEKARDDAKSAGLWELSERLCSVSFEDPRAAVES